LIVVGAVSNRERIDTGSAVSSPYVGEGRVRGRLNHPPFYPLPSREGGISI